MYKTRFGESIAVLGSIPELGVWKDIKVHLKWSDGHVWKLETPIKTNYSYFQYKYVLLDGGKLVSWERGIDRIIDLRALPESYATTVYVKNGSISVP
jgi:hypothetical protein